MNIVANKIFHFKSSGSTEIKIDKKRGMDDGLAYIEGYLKESGLELFNTQVGNVAQFFYLRGD